MENGMLGRVSGGGRRIRKSDRLDMFRDLRYVIIDEDLEAGKSGECQLLAA